MEQREGELPNKGRRVLGARKWMKGEGGGSEYGEKVVRINIKRK